jgi:hypothetical protein
MRLIKCDRCHRTVEGESRLTFVKVSTKQPVTGEHYDKELCGRCGDDLKRLLNDAPPQAARAA